MDRTQPAPIPVATWQTTLQEGDRIELHSVGEPEVVLRLPLWRAYDLSCALERQASVACAGYDHRDAVRIAVNVIRYALLQDIAFAGKIR